MVAARYVEIGLLGGVALFQAGLAAGLPWGPGSWGGTAAADVLPPGLRLASAPSCALLAGVTYAVVRSTGWSPRGYRG